MTALDRAPLVHPSSRAEWRAWLEANHASTDGVWLVTGRTGSGLPRVDYDAAVEEALCFGWVDGQAATIDDERHKQYFSPRRPGSPWARSNKERVERMLAEGKMTAAGQAVIERAKSDGSWSVFDSVDRLELPPELEAALDERPGARGHWNEWPDSAKRFALSSIVLAKREATRTSRIAKVADAAARNERLDR